MCQVTKREKHLMMHSVGSDISSEKPYRNYFAASEGNDPDLEVFESLCERGLMVRWKRAPVFTEGLVYFSVTDKGLELLQKDAY